MTPIGLLYIGVFLVVLLLLTRPLGSYMARVLIVDDAPLQLRLTAEVARRAGFTPVTASGGDEALSLLRADPEQKEPPESAKPF